MLTVQQLIEKLSEIEDKSLRVMLDVTTPDTAQSYFIAAVDALEGETSAGDKICLLCKADTKLWDEDGELIN
jgi:hypothetical protein